MKKPILPLPESEIKERLIATNPKINVWVSANAGSGKTTILRNRVVRMLLEDVHPSRILCLTFTKVAATEMQDRIFAELAKWVSLDEEILEQELSVLLYGNKEQKPPKSIIKNARTLFAKAMETPGGLKIQTIHAFAERILHLFPFETGLPLNFEVMEESEADKILDEARSKMIEKALSSPASIIGKAWGDVSSFIAQSSITSFADILEKTIEKLRHCRLYNININSNKEMIEAYRFFLDVPIGETLEKIKNDLMRNILSIDILKQFSDAIIASKPSDTQGKKSNKILEVIDEYEKSPDWIEKYLDLFLTDKGEVSSRNILVKDITKNFPHLGEEEKNARDAIKEYIARSRAFVTFIRSQSLLIIAQFVLEYYDNAKKNRSILDFEDLIENFHHLLISGSAHWVGRKLDAEIEHILVDEAQDTNPAMWDIIRALADEFFAGDGQIAEKRSIFVVGDEKQSIYSFQGVDLKAFEETRAYFGDRMDETSRIKKPVPLQYSFRSASEILKLVDAVFSSNYEVSTKDNLFADVKHSSALHPYPGFVEIWPLERAEPKIKVEKQQFSTKETPKYVKLAEKIAEKIESWLKYGERHFSDGQKIKAGDILVLVQKRSPFFIAVVRALKQRNIPLSSAERVQLQDELIIQDLLVIAEAVLLEKNDLALATALKTPIFGLNDEEIEGFARFRKGSLFDAFEIAAKAGEKLHLALNYLRILQQKALICSPFEFFSFLLQEKSIANHSKSGRAMLLTRLGVDKAEALEFFLDQALEFSDREARSLQSFIISQKRTFTEIKSDMEQGRDEVRIMTVHGAKGLEGRIVFLCDTVGKPDSGKQSSVYLYQIDVSKNLLLWAGRKEEEPEILQQLRQIERDKLMREYNRQLYVALTRASDRLYIGGYSGAITKEELKTGIELKSDDEGLETCWYQRIRAGFSKIPSIVEESIEEHNREDLAPFDRKIKRLISNFTFEKHIDEASYEQKDIISTPPWLMNKAPLEGITPQTISPSLNSKIDYIEDDFEGKSSFNPRYAKERGILLHRLLASLPHVIKRKRIEAGKQLLQQWANGWAHNLRDDMVQKVIKILNDPLASIYFNENSKAEVGIIGSITLPNGEIKEIYGRIDRLVESDNQINILEMKSGYPNKKELKEGYIQQIALYYYLINSIYPQRKIICHLLWIEENKWEEISPLICHKALEQWIQEEQAQIMLDL